MRSVYAILLLPALCLASTISAAEKDAVTGEEKGMELVPSITVSGKGEASGKPDMAQITVGVVTEAETAAEALEANTAKMNELFDVLKRSGIAEKDMQTSNFNVQPQYRHDDRGRQPPKIVGYQVSNQVTIKVRRLSGLGKILDEVISNGANQVHGISFSIDDESNLLDDARRKALADARRKAELYAEAAGVKVGRPLLIQEHTASNPPRPMPYAMTMRAAAAESVPIASGEQELTATITVTYAMERASDGGK